MGYCGRMARTIRTALVIGLLAAPAGPVAAGTGGPDGWVGVMLGEHIPWDIAAPSFFPVLEFRAGYRVSRTFAMRIDLGGGITALRDPARETFAGASLFVGHASLAFLWTPALGDDLQLGLGGCAGLWMSSLWGENLLGTISGNESDYLEEISVAYGAVAGLDWTVADDLALSFEARANLAQVEWGGTYHTGGVSLLVGFVYRLASGGM